METRPLLTKPPNRLYSESRICVRVLTPERAYHIVPATWKGLLVILALVLFFTLLVTGLISYAIYSARRARFVIGERGLRIERTLYGRLIPWESILVGGVRWVNLNLEEGLRPAIKTNGVDLPGFKAGWFRLVDGQKALVFLTDYSHVVYVPTKEGYVVLLSVGDPLAFVRDLRRAWSDQLPSSGS